MSWYGAMPMSNSCVITCCASHSLKINANSFTCLVYLVEEEAWDLGLTEYFDGDGLNFVEWPEQAPGVLPADTVLLEVRVNGLQHDGTRELFLSVPHQRGM